MRPVAMVLAVAALACNPSHPTPVASPSPSPVQETSRGCGLPAGGPHERCTIELPRGVKNSDAFDEQYQLMTSLGYVRWGAGAYRSTCFPSWF